MNPDEQWVFIVQHSKGLHYQIVDCDQKFEPAWVRLLKKLRPVGTVLQTLIPYLLF